MEKQNKHKNTISTSSLQFSSPFGEIRIQEEGSVITSIQMLGDKEIKQKLKTQEGFSTEMISPVLQYAKKELEEYFQGKRKVFTFPIKLKGTPFQIQVWEALLTIPYGETRSYKDIAQQIQHPKAFRAVGGANNKNQLPIRVPCHRVIGANGAMVGFNGGVDKKLSLLLLEKIEKEMRTY